MFRGTYPPLSNTSIDNRRMRYAQPRATTREYRPRKWGMGGLLDEASVKLNGLRNHRFRRRDTESRLQEADDAPDGNHDENRDNAHEHDLQSLRFSFLTFAKQIFDETPEENNNCASDEEIHERIQERRDECERVEQCLRRCENR